MKKIADIKREVLGVLKKDLSQSLHYHSIQHTKQVYKNTLEICKALKISKSDTHLLKTAALFHDLGFVKVYNGHEEESCKMAKKFLPKYEYTKSEILIIEGMIMATKIPQSPKTELEKIIADADLTYLGTGLFKEIGDSLYQEINLYFNTLTYNDWNQIQIKFLENHSFHTTYCQEKYGPSKAKNLAKLKKSLT